MGRIGITTWLIVAALLFSTQQIESAQKSNNFKPLLPVGSNEVVKRAVFMADMTDSQDFLQYSRCQLGPGVAILDDECKVVYKADIDDSRQFWVNGKVTRCHDTVKNWSFDHPTILDMDGKLVSVLSSSTLFPERNMAVITKADRFEVIRLSDGHKWFMAPRNPSDSLFPLTDDLMCLKKINDEARILNMEGQNAFDSIDVVKQPYKCKNGILLVQGGFVNLSNGQQQDFEKIIGSQCFDPKIGDGFIHFYCISTNKKDPDFIFYDLHKLSFDGKQINKQTIRVSNRIVLISIDTTGDYAVLKAMGFSDISYYNTLICMKIDSNKILWSKSWLFDPFSKSPNKFAYSLFHSDGFKMRLELDRGNAILDLESGKVLHEYMLDYQDTAQNSGSKKYIAVASSVDSKQKEILECQGEQIIRNSGLKLAFDFFNVFNRYVLAVKVETEDNNKYKITSTLADKENGIIRRDVSEEFENLIPLSNNNIYKASKTVIMCNDRSIWIEDVTAGKTYKKGWG